METRGMSAIKQKAKTQPTADMPPQRTTAFVPELGGHLPRPDLHFPGSQKPCRAYQRDWYHWPLVCGGRLLGKAIVQSVWTTAGLASWRPLARGHPEHDLMRRIICLETLSPVPGIAAWLVEYVQNIADAGAARWHLTPPCMVEVEDRRTRLLTWLGLAGATTLQRFCCLLLEVAYLPVVVGAVVISPTFTESLVSCVDQHILSCYAELYERMHGGDLALWAATFAPDFVSRMWGLEEYSEVGTVLRLMLDAPVTEGMAGFVLPSPSTGPPSDVMLEDLQQPLKELRGTLNAPSVNSDQAFSDALLSSKTLPGHTVKKAAKKHTSWSENGENGGLGEPLPRKRNEKNPDRLLKKMDQLWGSY